MEYFLIGILCVIVVISIWAHIFQTINPDVQYRIIRRGEGYAIQKRGTFKWHIMTDETGLELIFGDRMIAGMIVAEALKQSRAEKGL